MRIHYPKLHNMTHVLSFSVFIAFKWTNFLFLSSLFFRVFVKIIIGRDIRDMLVDNLHFK